jgi:hypothetical protein
LKTRDIRLKVFENRVLRRVFGPTMDEETGEWIKLHNEEQYFVGGKMKKNVMGWACGAYGGGQSCVEGLVGKA